MCIEINLKKIFIKNYKSTHLGSNKVVYGPCETVKEPKKINHTFDFSICKIVLL